MTGWAVWLGGLALNCAAVAVAGPGAVLGILGGALVAVASLMIARRR